MWLDWVQEDLGPEYDLFKDEIGREIYIYLLYSYLLLSL